MRTQLATMKSSMSQWVLERRIDQVLRAISVMFRKVDKKMISQIEDWKTTTEEQNKVFLDGQQQREIQLLKGR